jgi:hypothetical protein
MRNLSNTSQSFLIEFNNICWPVTMPIADPIKNAIPQTFHIGFILVLLGQVRPWLQSPLHGGQVFIFYSPSSRAKK